MGNPVFKGCRGRVIRSVEVANASPSCSLKLGHYAVQKQVRIVVGRVDGMAVLWPKTSIKVLAPLRMLIGLNHASPSSLTNSPLIAEAIVCIVPVKSFMADWVSKSISCLRRMPLLLPLGY